MQLGAIIGPGIDGGDPAALPDQARRFEAEGFDALWAVHTVGRGFMVADPLVTLAVAAVVTDHVELGTAIVQVPLSSPGMLAHRTLSVAQLAGPRLTLGVGVGSTDKDFAVSGGAFADRFAAFDATIGDLRQTLATGATDRYDLAAWPSVVGRVPVVLGTWGAGVEVAARDYDGWIASNAYRTADEVVAAHARFRAAGGGRAIVSTIGVGADTDLGELRDRLARFADTGFDQAVVLIRPDGPTPAVVRDLVPSP